MHVYRYPHGVHFWTDGHVPMCTGVESGYLPYIVAFNIHLIVM